MAYPGLPKEEDPNATYRTKAAGIKPVSPPVTPYVPSPTGGAPVLPNKNTAMGAALSRAEVNPQLPGLNPSGPPHIVGPGGTQNPTGLNPAPFPWQTGENTRPTQGALLDRPNWDLRTIRDQEPNLVKELSQTLFKRFQETPEAQRNSIWWQGVRQNPELAAATMIRRMMHNALSTQQALSGERVPTLTEAAQNLVENNQIRQWMDWARGRTKADFSAPTRPIPRRAR